ncbi:MAG: DHHA1 domain-containing protein [Candidatus Nanohaloarchaea archaeon]
MTLKEIRDQASEAVEKIKEFDEKIRLVGQYDADGISATAIAHQMLERAGKNFEYEILKQLYDEDVKRLKEEEEGLILFVDIGSGKASKIEEILMDEKEVVVSDHHEPSEKGSFPHMNPHFLGFDGGEAISAAGMTFVLAHEYDEENIDLVEYALIGATGDMQKQGGEFIGLNAELEELALENGIIEKRQGLDLYGRTTKPLKDSLKYTTDPYLPGISNDENGAVQFVQKHGVEIRKDGEFRTLSDLTEKEEKKLINGLIKTGRPVQPLLNDIYTLKNGYEIGEFSTVINACGRLGRAEEGVEILVNQDLELADRISTAYGRKISESLRFVEENQENEEYIYERDGLGVIDAEDNIQDDFIGTVATISMSNGFFDSEVVMGVAEMEDEKSKVSARASKDAVEKGLNLGDIIGEICEELDGEGGGHNVAAGAKIPRENKDKFIEMLGNKISQEY